MTIIGVPPVEVRWCEWCGSDLRGEQIPGTGGAPRFFTRTVLVNVPGQYDGGLFFECPDCGHRWHRWPEEDFRHRRADPYVRDAQRRCARGANTPAAEVGR